MNLIEKYLKKMPAPAEAMPLIKAALIKPTDTPQAEPTDLFNISEAGRAKPTKTSTPSAPDTDLLNISVSSWLEKLSDDERDTYQERAAIMEYDGGLPREQAEVEAIKIIIRERVIPGKCDKCDRVDGCMMTRGQRRLCGVVR